jgi:hypothetical protein
MAWIAVSEDSEPKELLSRPRSRPRAGCMSRGRLLGDVT